MALFALIIGMILIVSAVRNSQGALFTAIGKDAPSFLIWAAAILAIGAVGFIPGLKPVSRLLLALIIVVLVVNNYKAVTTGFQNAWQNPGAAKPGSASAQSSGATGATGAASVSTGPQDWLSIAKQLGSQVSQ